MISASTKTANQETAAGTASQTAVDEFVAQKDRGAFSPQAKHYSRLLPATEPGPGQQYAFRVDLDRCSGCKACVTACHSLNGLDEGETWREVGLLIGGSSQLPVLQHVTSACHHCLDPACLTACPVDAYEKNPVTGIVKHLDDQCFGCRYCTFACPYEVPKYHRGKGIVRKCDMCSGRLAVGEAPACVQACPARGDLDPRWSIRGKSSRIQRRIYSFPGAGADDHLPDDHVRDEARLPAKYAAGRLSRAPSRARALAALRHAGADSAFRGGVSRRLGPRTVRITRAFPEYPAAQRDLCTRVWIPGAGDQRAAPGPPAIRISCPHRVSDTRG